MRNRLREILSGDTPGFGVSIKIPDPTVIELVALAGLDFAFIDLEHSGIGLETLQGLYRTALGHGLGTIVRAPGPKSEQIARLVDLGTECLLVPRVTSADEVRSVIATTRFPPIGERGVAEGCRTTDWGAIEPPNGLSMSEHLNRTQVVGVMIETVGALNEIEEIVSLDGLDFIFIGPEDLAASMGFIGVRGRPEVRQAVDRIFEVATKAGMSIGTSDSHPAAPIPMKELIERKVSLVLTRADTKLLLTGLQGIRSAAVAALES